MYTLPLIHGNSYPVNQINWVTYHLGYTLQLHEIHYRQAMADMQWFQEEKLLLIQDNIVAG